MKNRRTAHSRPAVRIYLIDAAAARYLKNAGRLGVHDCLMPQDSSSASLGPSSFWSRRANRASRSGSYKPVTSRWSPGFSRKTTVVPPLATVVYGSHGIRKNGKREKWEGAKRARQSTRHLHFPSSPFPIFPITHPTLPRNDRRGHCSLSAKETSSPESATQRVRKCSSVSACASLLARLTVSPGSSRRSKSCS